MAAGGYRGVEPYFNSDARVRLVVGGPQKSVDGTVLEGHLFWGDDGSPKALYDRSGRPDMYPWDLLAGPVLEIDVLRPRRPALLVFRHPDWGGRPRGKGGGARVR